MHRLGQRRISVAFAGHVGAQEVEEIASLRERERGGGRERGTEGAIDCITLAQGESSITDL